MRKSDLHSSFEKKKSLYVELIFLFDFAYWLDIFRIHLFEYDEYLRAHKGSPRPSVMCYENKNAIGELPGKSDT